VEEAEKPAMVPALFSLSIPMPWEVEEAEKPAMVPALFSLATPLGAYAEPACL